MKSLRYLKDLLWQPLNTTPEWAEQTPPQVSPPLQEPVQTSIPVPEQKQSKPAAPQKPAAPASRPSKKLRVEEMEERFVNDLLIQEHQFFNLKERFLAAVIRGASTQAAVLKRLRAKGWIHEEKLATQQGRPGIYSEPTEALLTLRGVTWKKTRGTLRTRAATHFMHEKLKALKDWMIIREGVLEIKDLLEVEKKQVDLLCRHTAGEVVTVEIGGNPDHEVVNCLHCLKEPMLKKHVVVCVDETTKTAVKKNFKAVPEIANDKRVEVITLTEALKKEWTL